MTGAGSATLPRALARLGRRLWVRGPAGERGAIAVAVALLFPLFFGCAALAVDSAAVWNSRTQVLSGADAAALAVATDCARGACVSRSEVAATLQHYWLGNTEQTRRENLVPGTTSLRVDDTVHSYRTQGTWTIEHYFSGLLGVADARLTAESMARWAPASSAAAELPLAVSWCSYQQAVGSAGVGSPQSTVTTPLQTASDGSSCTAPGGGALAGGLTMLRPTSVTCGVTSSVGTSVTTATTSRAAAVPCTDRYLANLRGTDIRVPIYDQVASDGSSVRVYGYAAFRVTAVTSGSPATVTGYFTYAATQVETPTAPLTAPDLGARVVFLADPAGG